MDNNWTPEKGRGELISKDAPVEIRRQAMDTFIANLRKCGNVSYSAKEASIARSTAYLWRKDYKTFAKDWDDALEEACDALEEEARRRAVDGVDEPVYYMGERIDTVKKYSDTLLIFLLKAHRPGKYRETVRQELSGPDGGPIVVKGYGNVNPDEWDGDETEEG